MIEIVLSGVSNPFNIDILCKWVGYLKEILKQIGLLELKIILFEGSNNGRSYLIDSCSQNKLNLFESITFLKVSLKISFENANSVPVHPLINVIVIKLILTPDI